MTKKQLRQYYSKQRQSVSLPETHRLIAGMLEHFQKISFPVLYYLLSFRSSSAKLEVPIHFFEEYLQDENRDLSICYPKADFQTGHMEAYVSNDNLGWEQTPFDFEQPKEGDMVLPLQLDCVLVPLLAFDPKGYRVGYGKGFYDRYLARCRSDVLKIGVSFFEATPLISDTNDYDIPLNYCITPQQLYVF